MGIWAGEKKGTIYAHRNLKSNDLIRYCLSRFNCANDEERGDPNEPPASLVKRKSVSFNVASDVFITYIQCKA